MNWLKVAGIVIGALIAFLIIGSVVHVIMALLGYVVIAAIVAGGGYVAYKLATSSQGRKLRDRRRGGHEIRDEDQGTGYAPPPPGTGYTPPALPKGNVDDDLARLRREMGR
jgi:hypothetical protein